MCRCCCLQKRKNFYKHVGTYCFFPKKMGDELVASISIIETNNVIWNWKWHKNKLNHKKQETMHSKMQHLCNECWSRPLLLLFSFHIHFQQVIFVTYSHTFHIHTAKIAYKSLCSFNYLKLHNFHPVTYFSFIITSLSNFDSFWWAIRHL